MFRKGEAHPNKNKDLVVGIMQLKILEETWKENYFGKS